LKIGQIDTYVEPFAGGGAIFFHIAQNFDSIKYFYLLDINEDLVNCYKAIKEDVDSLINDLQSLERRFHRRKNKSAQKEFYYEIRKKFNEDKKPAQLIFLNKTCFNGLYRVNRKGGFNVPSGDYKNPKICNAENLYGVSELLQKTDLICGDFTVSEKYIDTNTFVYFDPPYRPISSTASFTSYSKEAFGHDEQVELSQFCKSIHKKGAKFLLSNSDPKNEDSKDHFFEDHYKGFNIERVKASRVINCKAFGRGEINELLITNYKKHFC
jgi:DNA adenine methylase